MKYTLSLLPKKDLIDTETLHFITVLQVGVGRLWVNPIPLKCPIQVSAGFFPIESIWAEVRT